MHHLYDLYMSISNNSQANKDIKDNIFLKSTTIPFHSFLNIFTREILASISHEKSM